MVKFKKDYDYVILAVGTQNSIQSTHDNVLNGFDVLKKYHKGNFKFPKNGHQLVLGGGNTAMDVASYLLKNENEVTILVRREKLRAFEDEINLVKGLGANIIPLAEMKLWNSKSKKAYINIANNEEIWDIDKVFVCFGQDVDEEWKDIVKMDKSVIKIGDTSTIDSTVVHAIASGYHAAHDILIQNGLNTPITVEKRVADESMINVEYWKLNKKKALDPKLNFKEEAERCMQCGTCTACGVCETFCPDLAVCVDKEADFNYDYCKGCEICAEECPRGVISVREVGE